MVCVCQLRMIYILTLFNGPYISWGHNEGLCIKRIFTHVSGIHIFKVRNAMYTPWLKWRLLQQYIGIQCSIQFNIKGSWGRLSNSKMCVCFNSIQALYGLVSSVGDSESSLSLFLSFSVRAAPEVSVRERLWGHKLSNTIQSQPHHIHAH